MNSARPPGPSTRAASSSTADGFSEVSSPCISDQPVDEPGRQGPGRVLAENADVLHPGGPGHHPLRPRHQPDHAPRLGQVGPQSGTAKPNPATVCPRLAAATAAPPDPGSPAAPPGPAGCGSRNCSGPAHQDALRRPSIPSILSIIPKGRPKTMPLQLVTIPCLADNYAYLIHDAETGQTAVIDVPEAAPILAALNAHQWRLTDILITHHHDDHIQGVDTPARPDRRHGPWCRRRRPPPAPPRPRARRRRLRFSVGTEFARVIDVPGHTLGHIAFHFPAKPPLLHRRQPDGRRLRPPVRGHRPPDVRQPGKARRPPARNADLFGPRIHRRRTCALPRPLNRTIRSLSLVQPRSPPSAPKGMPTVPVPLSEELATNPFLRAHLPALKTAVGLPDADDVTVFAEIRARKDKF